MTSSTSKKEILMKKRSCNAMEEFFADNNVRFGIFLSFDNNSVSGEDKLPSLSSMLYACQSVSPLAAPLQLKRVDNSGDTVIDPEVGEEVEQDNEWCIVCDDAYGKESNSNSSAPLVSTSVKVSMINSYNGNNSSGSCLSSFLNLRMSEQHSALPPVGPLNIELFVSLPSLQNGIDEPVVKGILLDSCHALYDGHGLVNIATSILNFLNKNNSDSRNLCSNGRLRVGRALLADTTQLIERSLWSIMKNHKEKRQLFDGSFDGEEDVPYLPPSHWTEEGGGSLLHITDLPGLIVMEEDLTTRTFDDGNTKPSYNHPLRHSISKDIIDRVRKLRSENNISMTALLATLLLSSLYTTTMKNIDRISSNQIDEEGFLGISVLVDLRSHNDDANNTSTGTNDYGDDNSRTEGRRSYEIETSDIGIDSFLPLESQLRIGCGHIECSNNGAVHESINYGENISFLPQAFGTVTLYLPCQRFYDNDGNGEFVKPTLPTLLDWSKELTHELQKRVLRGEAHRSSLAMFRNDGGFLLQDLPEATMELSDLGLLPIINKNIEVYTQQHFDGYEGFRSMTHTEEGSGVMRIVSSVGNGLNRQIISDVIDQFIDWMELLSAQVI